MELFILFIVRNSHFFAFHSSTKVFVPRLQPMTHKPQLFSIKGKNAQQAHSLIGACALKLLVFCPQLSSLPQWSSENSCLLKKKNSVNSSVGFSHCDLIVQTA